VKLNADFFEHLAEFKLITGLDAAYVLDPEGVNGPQQAPGRLYVVVQDVALPPGLFKVEKSDILFLGDYQYPESALDMFWTSLDMIRPDGRIPQNAEVVESYLGREWRRYSWHRNGTWNPSRNGILDHYEFMLARVAEELRR
jgi:hypothetical protein